MKGGGHVKRYLSCLIAPDTAEGARAAICDWTAITELDELAGLLAQLHQLVPAATTALMELRIWRGFRLLERSKAETVGDERMRLGECDILIGEMARVRVAYVLRMIATDCVRQIHEPYSPDAMDGLGRSAAGGTVR